MFHAQPKTAAALAFALIFPITALAREYRCSVVDPAGDSTDAPGIGFNGEAFQDMLRSSIERGIGAVTFSMEVAAAVPSAPRMKNPNGLLLWMWGMNTGSTFPLGYPLAPGNAGLLEFWIHLAWNGKSFYAEVIDRRPTVQGGQPIITSVPFVIDGQTIKVIAPVTLFDDPSVFRWGSTTWFWSSQLGSSGGHPVDRAPDEHVTTCTAN